jgi:hypothetical protein
LNAVRASNDRIAQRAEALHFASRVPMLCECGDPNCRALVLVSLEGFRHLRRSGGAVIADEHGRRDRSA